MYMYMWRCYDERFSIGFEVKTKFAQYASLCSARSISIAVKLHRMTQFKFFIEAKSTVPWSLSFHQTKSSHAHTSVLVARETRPSWEFSPFLPQTLLHCPYIQAFLFHKNHFNVIDPCLNGIWKTFLWPLLTLTTKILGQTGHFEEQNNEYFFLSVNFLLPFPNEGIIRNKITWKLFLLDRHFWNVLSFSAFRLKAEIMIKSKHQKII